MHCTRCARAVSLFSTGNSSVARMRMTTMVTQSSMMVKPPSGDPVNLLDTRSNSGLTGEFGLLEPADLIGHRPAAVAGVRIAVDPGSESDCRVPANARGGDP